jgi:hypothetical protein
MLAAWNERDHDKIRAHLDRALTSAVHFVDPTIETRGVDEFGRNVREFRTRDPHDQCIRTSGVDSHHGLARYSWEIRIGNQVIVQGFDVAEVDAAAKVRRVLGFFGPLPANTGSAPQS